jgi:acetyl esterase/lipase
MIRTLAALVALALAGCGANTIEPTATVSYADRPGAVFDLYRPSRSGPLPTVVFVHGGGFRAGSRLDGAKYASSLVRCGIQVVSIDYRLTSSGATWPAPLDDARDALRYVRAHAGELGAGKIGVAGASAGACLAELLAFEEDPRPDCLVALSGYGDLSLGPARDFAYFDSIMAGVFGHPAPFSADELAELSPALRARSIPALVAHSNHDTDVFIDQGDDLAAALGPSAIYMRRNGWAHGDDLWEQDGAVRGAVVDFLLRSLR